MSQRVKGTAIGIDLGTTYSCAAMWFRGKKRVEIIPNDQGNMITPSCVAFNDSELLVGKSAKNQITRNPTNTVFDAKRLIGSRFDDPQVHKDMKSWPFKLIKCDLGKPSVVVNFKGEEKIFPPEELSAMVLKKMKEATKEAGTIAVLNVLRLLNEPTAAAIAYGVDIMSEKQLNKDMSILVFDLGGGTFDVSLLTISKTGAIEVKAVGGDTHLGNPRAMARLKVACEKAKRDLSSTRLALIEIDCLYDGIDFSINISRAKFEVLNSTYFEKYIQLVEKCLCDGAMKKTDVDEVVVAGGSSRIPKVQQMVADFFDGKTLCKSLNGDEVVASGAAILAARLSGDDDLKQELVLLDVTPRSLGLSTNVMDFDRITERDVMLVIIPRNTHIPTNKKKIVYVPPNTTETQFSVYQGEGVKVTDNKLLGEFTFCGLTPCRNGISELDVCFNLDDNGILLVSV
nr:heat shock cognate 70 kDa protein-like [Tanacetum cinerariifolium]